MNLPRYAVQILLVLLFFVAAGLRFASTGQKPSPYFHGVSAMNYRHAVMTSDNNSLLRPTRKANWPDGYVPARYRAAGLEYATGVAFRVARYFSEVDGRQFVSRTWVLLFSLCVFLGYALGKNLWGCQAAGLLTAGLFAALSPLVGATNGTTFTHQTAGAVLIVLHLLLLVRHRRGGGAFTVLLAALVAFALLASWELATYYVALVCVVAVLTPAWDRAGARWIATSHLVALLVACLLLPHLKALRAVGSWQTACAAACVVVCWWDARLDARWKRAAAVAGGTLLVTLFLTPLRAGADVSIPALAYAWQRVLHPLGPPVSPSLVPDSVRALWRAGHAPPSAYQLLRMFLPLLPLAAAVAVGWRGAWRRHGLLFAGVAAAALVAALAYLVDRSALVATMVVMIPAVALAGQDLGRAALARGGLVTVGVLLAAADAFFPAGAVNPTFQLARATGIALQDKSQFMWVTMRNTEADLVAFVAQRTSTRDPFLGSRDETGLLLTFSGRTSVLLEGGTSPRDAAKTIELTRALYGDEDALYQACHRLKVHYVLYAVDDLVDTSPYSPRYLAGLATIPPHAAVMALQFAPETLKHFTLVYENERYRLFQVTDQAEPTFLTDHPIAYQRDILDGVGDDLDAFRRRIAELTLTYRAAVVAREHGNVDGALQRLRWCIEHAPGYTDARVAIASTLIKAHRLKDARTVLLDTLHRSPDNAHALYETAYTFAALGDSTSAQTYLKLFFSATKDPALVQQGRVLQTFIDQGIPLEAPELRE